MMKSFIIAWKDFKIRFTDRKAFFMMIFFPIILTAILGSALSGIMGSSSLPVTTVGVIQNDQDPIGTIFVNKVLKGKDLTDVITVKKASTEMELQSLLKKGKIDVGIAIPNYWSKDIQSGKLKQVKLYTDPGKTLQSSVTETIIQTFVNRVMTVSESTRIVLTNSAGTLTPNEFKHLASQLTGSLVELEKTKQSYFQESSVGKKQVSGMQYYAAAMAAMFLLFNVLNGAKSFIHERDTETLARLMSTPTSKLSILAGKFLGNLYCMLAQFWIFLAATYFLFKVNWGENILQTILIGFAYSIAVCGLSMLFAALIKNLKTADIVGGIGVQVFSILGGSMFPLTVFPKAMLTAANVAPNKWALSSFIDIMSGTSWETLVTPMIVLMMIGCVSIIIGTWRLQVR